MKKALYVFLLLFSLSACSKNKPSGNTVPAKPEILNLYPGKERVKLEFSFSDNNIAYFDVYWKGREKSKRINRSESANGVVNTFIEQLEEGNHTFDVVAYDAAGTASPAARTQGRAYGPSYEAGLTNLLAKELVNIEAQTPYIEWNGLQGEEVALDVDYTTEAGTLRRVRATKEDAKTLLPDYKQLSEISYQTRFLPEPNCIDTFSAPKESISFITLYKNLTAKNIVEKSGLINRILEQTTSTIHPDIEYTTLKLENASGAPYSLFVLRADLSKGSLSLTTLMPNNSTQFGLQTVKSMAEHRDAAGGKIIAAVNADFFDWSPVAGSPWGPVVVEGTVVKNSVKAGVVGTSYFGIKKDGTLSIDLVSALSPADYNNYQNLAGAGSNLLYLRGAPRVYNDVVREPRTMVGYTSDKILYLVVVDGRQPGHSVGMTIDELTAVMGSLNVYSATNLDGGGSSTMVLKNGNNFEIVNRYSDASPRAVANAIALKLSE